MDNKFTWKPDLGATQTEKPKVTVTQYGDGYEARTSYLLNNNPKSWEMTFTSPLERHRAILYFLREHMATHSFEWTDPSGEVGTYVAREWTSRQFKEGVFQIEVTFEQVFE